MIASLIRSTSYSACGLPSIPVYLMIHTMLVYHNVSVSILKSRGAFGDSMPTCIDLASTSCQSAGHTLQNNNGMLTCDVIPAPWIIPNGRGGTLFSLPSGTFGQPSIAASATGAGVRCQYDYQSGWNRDIVKCSNPTFLARNPGSFYMTEFRM